MTAEKPAALAVVPQISDADAAAIERVVMGGDLAPLTASQRVHYVNMLCVKLGLDPALAPFEYLKLNGKLVLYTKKSATEQLRSINNISVSITARELVDGCYVVTAQASTPKGRIDESVGAVPLPSGAEAKANAMMKAETKAKRRVTLSICGLGMLDESELDTIRGAQERAQADVQESKLKQLKAQATAPQGEPRHQAFADIDPEHPSAPAAPEPQDGGYEARATAVAAEAQAQIAGAAKPKAAPKLVSGKMLQEFGQIKTLLRDESDGTDTLYYSILDQFGYKKSNEIPTMDDGRAVYKSMLAAHLTLKKKRANREEIEDIARKLGPDKFWSILGQDLSIDADALEQADEATQMRILERLREEAK